jgi:hypothetical protein
VSLVLPPAEEAVVTWDIGPELRALAALCKELHLVGVGSELRDSLPGLAVRTCVPGVYVWVFVSTTGQWFVWNTTVMRHPINDPTGAAKQIMAFMQESGRL